MLVSLVVSAGIQAFSGFLGESGTFILDSLNLAVSVIVFTVFFALMYKALPNVKIRWNHVWLGAFITALLFSVGKFAIGFYLGRGAISSTYGAAASFVILISWIYYSSLIFFFGAEVTQVFANRFERSEFQDKRFVGAIR